ncbi:MAG: 50S ribosomal protein L28 [Deltaproteobacteria bacterium]|nr:50S ribosomal protein L28 [Deltaproteobacteria bacterium]
MSKVCELTGIRPLTGNNVSHSNRRTKTRQEPNLKKKRYFIPEIAQNVILKLSARAIRTVDKLGGISQALVKAKPEKLSTRLAKLQKQIIKARQKAA